MADNDFEIEDPEVTLLPQERLWRAVIAMQITDAVSKKQTGDAPILRHYALAWLRGDSEDFNIVSYMAGYDPGYLRRMMPRLLRFWDERVRYAFMNGCKTHLPTPKNDAAAEKRRKRS